MIDTLGSRLKNLRLSKHLRQDQLGMLVGLNKTAIHYYEADERQPPYATLVRLSDIFRVTCDYLLGHERKAVMDVSDLTAGQIAILKSLADDMARTNRRLKALGMQEKE